MVGQRRGRGVVGRRGGDGVGRGSRRVRASAVRRGARGGSAAARAPSVERACPCFPSSEGHGRRRVLRPAAHAPHHRRARGGGGGVGAARSGRRESAARRHRRTPRPGRAFRRIRFARIFSPRRRAREKKMRRRQTAKRRVSAVSAFRRASSQEILFRLPSTSAPGASRRSSPPLVATPRRTPRGFRGGDAPKRRSSTRRPLASPPPPNPPPPSSLARAPLTMSARAIASALVASSSRVASARRASGRWTSRGGARRGVAVPAPRAAAPSDSSEDVDDPSDLAASSNPLFTPEFVRAFTEAQDRIQSARRPIASASSEEVAQILERVGTERDLEELLPEEEPASPEDRARRGGGAEALPERGWRTRLSPRARSQATPSSTSSSSAPSSRRRPQPQPPRRKPTMRAKINAQAEDKQQPRQRREREASGRGRQGIGAPPCATTRTTSPSAIPPWHALPKRLARGQFRTRSLAGRGTCGRHLPDALAAPPAPLRRGKDGFDGGRRQAPCDLRRCARCKEYVCTRPPRRSRGRARAQRRRRRRRIDLAHRESREGGEASPRRRRSRGRGGAAGLGGARSRTRRERGATGGRREGALARKRPPGTTRETVLDRGPSKPDLSWRTYPRDSNGLRADPVSGGQPVPSSVPYGRDPRLWTDRERVARAREDPASSSSWAHTASAGAQSSSRQLYERDPRPWAAAKSAGAVLKVRLPDDIAARHLAGVPPRGLADPAYPDRRARGGPRVGYGAPGRSVTPSRIPHRKTSPADSEAFRGRRALSSSGRRPRPETPA